MVSLIVTMILSMAPLTNNRHAGFTLLELMLVIVLIGIISSAVLMTIAPNRKPLEQPATALLFTLKQALDKAEQQGTIYGLAIAENGWWLLRYDANGQLNSGTWQKLTKKPFVLPEGVTASLTIEQQTISLAPQINADIEPQLGFYAGGETSIFTLTLHYSNCQQAFNALGFFEFKAEEVSCAERH